MKNQLINSLNKLLDGQDILETYTFLVKVFEETGMYQEQAGVLEKICNITKDYSLLLAIADIFAEKIQNYAFAQKLYEIYLSKAQPVFYQKYSYVLDKLGMSLKGNSEFQDERNILLELSDRCVAGIYIMVLLTQRKEYDVLVECGFKIKCFENYIKEESKKYEDTSCLNDIIDAKKHLSRELSKIDHHNDANGLAIDLDPEYEAPYLNIIEDLLTYKNYNEAIDFYNNVYAPKFNQESKSSYIDLHWFISDKYGAYGQPYNAVKFQQMAIELELGKREGV